MIRLDLSSAPKWLDLGSDRLGALKEFIETKFNAVQIDALRAIATIGNIPEPFVNVSTCR